MSNNSFKKELSNLIKVLEDTSKLSEEVSTIINELYNCLKSGNKILICGNGGSEAEANHLAAEFIVRLKPTNNRKAIPVVSLSQNTAVLTACGNDLGFENIFSRSLEALGNQGDVLLSLSTSGESLNIIKALSSAKEKKIKSISFLGKDGGKAKALSDLKIIIPSDDVARIQECHLFLGHHIFSEVERKLF
jgi:D-sedoheptulose 7-phosphate isomerase